MNPLIPILLLVLGAVIALLGLARPVRTAVISVGVVLLAAVATITIGLRLPSSVTISSWAPSSLFPIAGWRLAADQISWVLALVMLVCVLAACLSCFVRLGSIARFPEIAAYLMLSAIALASLFAKDLLSLALGWTALAFCSIVILLASDSDSDDSGDRRREMSLAVLGLGVDLVASVLVLIAAVYATAQGTSGVLADLGLPSESVLYLFLGAVLRLNLYPFHRVLLAESGGARGVFMVLRLASAVTGVDAMAAVASQSATILLPSWFTVGLLMSGLAVAWLWWSRANTREGLIYFVLAQSALISLIVARASEWSYVGVVAQGMAMVLGSSVLFLWQGFEDDQSVWLAAPLLAVGMIVGLPLTVGYLGIWVLYTELVQGVGGFASGVGVFLTQVLLVAGGIKWALASRERLPVRDPFSVSMYALSLGLPLVIGVAVGLSHASLAEFLGAEEFYGTGDMFLSVQGLAATVAAVLACLVGAVLWRFHKYASGSTRPGRALTLVLDLNMGYTAMWVVLRFAGRILRRAGAVFEGNGGVLWALVFTFLALMVLWR